ncbi:MAG: STAS/SEC14 domain-containing protein [Salibacteraceae bacterium]
MQEVYRSVDNTQVTWFDTENQYYLMFTKGDVSHKIYQESNHALYDAMLTYKSMKFCYDLSEMKRTDMVSRAWYTTSFLPKFFRRYGGHFVAAIVRSQNRFENMSTEFLAKAASKLGMQGKVEFFDDLESAKSWIVQQHTAPPNP